jgi:serine/threonine protein kinase
VLTDLKKGKEIDGWVLQRPLGASDCCWLAENATHRAVLKFPPADAARDEALLNAFIRETWNATRIEADWFVRATEPEPASARYYLMEFIEAPSLKSLLRSRRLAVDEAVELGKFLAAAAQHLVRHDLIHGDLKPENILADSNYDRLRFKLVDLGSTVPVFSSASRAGTPSYLAPERFSGAPVSERTEIFAMGVTLYEAVTGRLPYGEIERFQTPHFTKAPPPSTCNPNLPAWLDSVILRACAIEPSRRYQHYSEIAYDLTRTQSRHGTRRELPCCRRIRCSSTRPASSCSSPSRFSC